jgi:hypothetical protein
MLCAATTFAQAPPPDSDDDEPAAILELGGAASRSLSDHSSSFGPAVAIEFTPIKRWLELEAGVTPLFRSHSTEWDVDLLFKKPWDLTKKVEFMAGIGPQWSRTSDHGVASSSWSGEAVLDFMFWPGAKRKFGWYVEPSFDYSFARGHERSVGLTGGLLIAIHSAKH